MSRRGLVGVAAGLATAVFVLLAWLGDAFVPVAPAPEPAVSFEAAPTAAEASALMRQAGYDLARVRDGEPVPPVFFTALPADLADLKRAEERKTLFVQMLLPLVLKRNQIIAARRERLMLVWLRYGIGGHLTDVDRQWLTDMAREYGVAEGALDELARRVDIIPPSLALAQAAQESGWGTSRFARHGNALYGQRAYAAGVPGLDPARAAPSENFKVRSFASLLDAIRSYGFNLNTHPAYADFRIRRAAVRDNGDELGGMALAAGLTRYSSTGEAYVRAIRRVIAANGLEDFDRARLGPSDGVRIVLPRP